MFSCCASARRARNNRDFTALIDSPNVSPISSIRTIVPVAQRQSRPVDGWQRGQQALDHRLALVLHRHGVRVGRCGRRDGAADRHLLWACHLVLQRQPVDALAPQPVDAVVRRDREQPGAEGALGVVARQVLVGADEGLLRRVFGFSRVAQQAVGQVVDRRLVALYQLPERRRVALAGQLDPLDFVAHDGARLAAALLLPR